MDLSLAKLLHQKWKQTIQVSSAKLLLSSVLLYPVTVRQRLPAVMNLAEVVDFYCPQVVKKVRYHRFNIVQHDFLSLR